MLFFLLLLVPVTSRADMNEHAAVLREKARALRLADDRYWDIIVHYKPRGGKRVSLIDDPRFFLSPSGKKDPQAELAATIDGFFADPGLGDNHPVCRFPLRFEWLKEKLAPEAAKLPAVSCPTLADALVNFSPHAATLIFPATHPNSPASMFGHTLIRVDSPAETKLLSHAVTYAAFTEGEEKGLLYGFKGLFGYYRGYYSILPYFAKIKEYNDMEYRDVWEYPLNLSPAEVRRMVLHIWEVKDVYQYYYFFDENCSYNLLFLLEAARPSINLTDRLFYWVTPVDTTRIIRDAGLIDAVKYRPSLVTKMRHTLSLMPDADRLAAKDAALGKISPVEAGAGLPPERRIRLLDVAADYLQYRTSKHEITLDEYRGRFYTLLRERSGLGAIDYPTVPVPVAPEDGHESGRVTAGVGSRKKDGFLEFSWRPAYHDLLNPDTGYEEGSEVKFMELTGRVYGDGDAQSFVLQDWTLLDIVSLAPIDRFFKPMSWEVSTGVTRKTLADGRDHNVARVIWGFGGAGRVGKTGIVYGFGEGDINYSGSFGRGWAGGAGASAGFVGTPASRWKLHGRLRSFWYFLGEEHRAVEAMLGQNFTVSRNHSISLEILREKVFGHYGSEFKLLWHIFL